MSSSIYEPETRKKCLEELKSIYMEYSMPVDYIEYLLHDFQEPEKDVVFLVDYSLSMNGARIKKVQHNVGRIINSCLKNRNRAAYILFNKVCSIAFNLIPKGLDCRALIEQINQWDSPKGGTAFYDAIALALQELQAYKMPDENIIPFDQDEVLEKKRLHWIVAVIDGEDNSSVMSFGQIRRRLAKSQANFIAVGLGISKVLQESIQELCNVTKKGLYIDSPSTNDLDKAFQILAAVISSKVENIESLD